MPATVQSSIFIEVGHRQHKSRTVKPIFKPFRYRTLRIQQQRLSSSELRLMGYVGNSMTMEGLKVKRILKWPRARTGTAEIFGLV